MYLATVFEANLSELSVELLHMSLVSRGSLYTRKRSCRSRAGELGGSIAANDMQPHIRWLSETQYSMYSNAILAFD